MRFPQLLEDQLRPDEVDATWAKMLRSDLNLTPAETLLIETWFCERGAAVPLNGRFTYVKTLATMRQRVALALYDYAREINWRRPVLFVTAMRLARSYLRDCLSNQQFIPEGVRGDFRGRLGVATVLISRFSRVPYDDALEAMRALSLSLAEGNEPRSAVPYLLEAGILEADLSGSPTQLIAVLQASDVFEQEPVKLGATWALAEVDARLRTLQQGAPTNAQVLGRCVELLRIQDEWITPEEVVHRDMLGVLLHQIRQQPSGSLDGAAFAHLRLPFGLRHGLGPELHPDYLRDVANALRVRVRAGNGVAKAVLADVLEQCLDSAEPEARLRLIEEMIELRDMADERSCLRRWRDELRLARLTRDTRMRNQAIEGLLAYPRARATALLLVGRDLEENGPCHLQAASPQRGQYLDALAGGDALALYKAAAEYARESPDLTEIALGGRSDVTTVGDYYGLIGETFVFKTTHSSNWEREQGRIELVRQAIASGGKDKQFGVAEQLEAFPASESGKIVTVRRFLSGRSLREEALHADHDDAVQLLCRVAQFLALINRAESGVLPAVGVRKEMMRKIRWWFESIGASRNEATDLFDRWWSLTSGQYVVRRDAHLDNWLLAAGRVVAIDLEATGHTPLGYDLAQITDDSELLEPEDWTSRRYVLDAYGNALGDLWDSDRGDVSYEASVLARAAWKLSMPDPRASPLVHARKTMGYLAGAGSPGVKELAAELLLRWSAQRGLEELPLEDELAPGTRKRISKAMAYHLRHGTDVELDESGWAQVDNLSAAIGELPSRVIAAAIDPAEKRFELAGQRIRALYGHSRQVDIERPSAPAVPLVHGTSMKAAEAILDSGEGLRPISRQWVHLSSSVPDALVAAQRHGAPLVLDIQPSVHGEVLKASASTFLTRKVPVERLTVRPLYCYWAHLEPSRPVGQNGSALQSTDLVSHQ